MIASLEGAIETDGGLEGGLDSRAQVLSYRLSSDKGTVDPLI